MFRSIHLPLVASLLLTNLPWHEARAQHLRILPLGDSITYGEGGAFGFGGYRGPLYNLLVAAGFSVDYLGTASDNSQSIPDRNHEGHRGYRIDQIDANIAGWLNAVGTPDLVLLHIGTNDFIQGGDNLNAIRRLDALITKIATLRPSAHIIASSLIPVMEPENNGPPILFNALLPDLVDAHIAAGRFVSFVDMHAVVSPYDEPDRIHPTQAGYLKMAYAWFDAIVAVAEPAGTVPPAIVGTSGTAARDEVVITFNKRLDPARARAVANYSIDHGLAIHSARLSGYGRIVTLVTDRQALGTDYMLTVSGVVDTVTPTPNPIAPGASATFFAPTPPGYFNHIDEAQCYTLVQSLDIPDAADFSSGAVPYALDFRERIGAFDRVAYYLELQRAGGDLQYVWASMDAFTTDLAQLGVPVASSGTIFQQAVEHLNVASNVPGVAAGTGRRGNLEFWPSDSSPSNSAAVPGASDTALDFGDSPTGSGNYGSMQVHDTSSAQTLIAFNRWGGVGGAADVGIGNRPSGAPDWTLAQNAGDFTIKRLQVLVRTTGDATPPALAAAEADSSKTQLTVRFSEPVRRDTLVPANFSLDQGVAVLGVTAGLDLREVTLLTTPQPAAPLTLTVSQIRDASQNANPIAPGATIGVARPSLPAEVLANIGAASDGYELVYTMEIPAVGNFNAASPYLIDNSAGGGAITRVAYYLELQRPGSPAEYVWAAMAPFSPDKRKLGVPTLASAASFRNPVTNLEVLTNSPGVAAGSWPSGGNIEFWPRDYATANTAGVPGASASVYDFGDDRLATGNYGSMQIHNAARSQTLFALNGWGADGRVLDLGIGNRPTSHPDWTSAANAASYSRRVLHVMTVPAAPAPVPAEVLARVPEAIAYELVYSLDLPARGNLAGGAGFAPYRIDRSVEAGPFRRIAYFLELQRSGEPEPTFVWVSMDAFTADRAKVGVPNAGSGAVFQQLATNLNIVSNSPRLTTGTGLAGNLEFWPGGYEARNALPVPGASGAIYDFGDNPASGDYGSMQVHNFAAGETVFAINHWGTAGSTSNPLCLGIGSNPNPVNGATDYTFADNAPAFDQLRRLHVFVLPGSPAIDEPKFGSVYASASGDRLLVNFDREVSDASAHPEHFSIGGGVEVTAARLLPGHRDIVLETTPQAPGTVYTLSANRGILARGASHAEMPAGTAVQFTAYLPPAVLSNVPDPGYELIYQLDLPSATPRWNSNPIPYSVDETRFGGRQFDRVAYLLQLDDDWLYVSFDAHTRELTKIGVPTIGVTRIPFQQTVTNMDVASNVPGIVAGNGITTGNLEFWSGDYAPAPVTPVPNASNSSYDFGDRMIDGSYGCMQVHNHGASQTLFAYNNWGSRANGISELGIGNNPAGGSPDWSLTNNANSWTTRRLFVLARSGGTASGPAPAILSNPCDHVATAGGSATFSVDLAGDGPFAIQWRRDGIALPGRTNSWLELDQLTPADAGAYDAVITAANFATTISRPARLSVTDRPASPFERWLSEHGLAPDSDPLTDSDRDGLIDLLEFGFGTDPHDPRLAPLAPDGSAHGLPTIASTPPGGATFVRRSDHGQPGSLTYTVQFSSDLRSFHDSNEIPSVIANSTADAAYQIVSVPFPPPTQDGTQPRYLRIKAELVPN